MQNSLHLTVEQYFWNINWATGCMKSYVTTPPQPRSKYNARKIILWSLLVIVVLLMGGWFYWTTNKKQIIRAKLEKAIDEKTGGVYKIDYAGMEMDEFAGDLTMMNMRVGYDNARYDSLVRLGKTPS